MKSKQIVHASFNGQSSEIKSSSLKSIVKKWMILGLVLAMLAGNGATVAAMTDAGDGRQVISTAEVLLEPEEHLPSYGSYTGTVSEVQPLTSLEGAYHVVIGTDEINTEDGELSPIWFTVTKDTLFFDDQRPEVGDTITGFYDKNAPMLMIYPPQYRAVAMAVNPGDTNYFVGHFDDDLVDPDNRLMLVIVEETIVQLSDGTPYEESLKNQVLAVAYGASTRSIPAQTRPEKVILVPTRENSEVTDEGDEEGSEGGPEAEDSAGPEDGLVEDVEDGLDENLEEGRNEDMEHAPLFGQPFRTEDWMPAIDTADIVVEMDILTNAPAPMTNEERVIMVPLKHIAEALGYNVMWNSELRMVMLSDSFTVTIGQDAYVDMSKDAPLSLGTAPVIRDGRTFVPLHFFRDVIPMNNVYYFEHQIVIDNQEKMY